ncbi:MAG: glycoside hydrolase family 2 protein [Phycisphaeraceae bacterium]|nr:MAG: glycoside hydrolase family 2 protein [Phycisphaeraceae bacterium]
MRSRVTLLPCVLAVAGFATPGVRAADSGMTRDRLFDDGWLFQAGNDPAWRLPALDDSGWRSLDLPHDWSIEDLPPDPDATPDIDVVTGDWRFHEGDSLVWAAPFFDDRDWDTATLPATWEAHAGYTQDYVFGWYRRQIDLPGGADLMLLLGKIDDADEVYLNGQLIGSSGSFPPNYVTAWDVPRRYLAPASLINGDGTDLLAVRVFDGVNGGGIYESGVSLNSVGPFDPAASVGADKTGYVLGGAGWYRKHFETPIGERVAIRFDGVYMLADVWINGSLAGTHTHGYTGFECDLTPYLAPTGGENVVAVRVRNEGKNSRWYSGSGIYRHVWLTVTDAVRIPTWGVFVTTPEVTGDQATINVSVEVENGSAEAIDATVEVTVRDPADVPVGVATGEVSVAPGEVITTERSLVAPEPRLWSPGSPDLYTAQTRVLVGGVVVDRVVTSFGVRTIEVDSVNGFRLNGEPMLLKGGCLHHDNGPLGAAAIDRAEERRVELIKSLGFNAVRSSHNPPSPAFLEACDRLGLLVIDEAFDQWNEHKLDCTEDYSRYFAAWHGRDIASMVRRDRNHPSVIFWSIGNEIPEQFRAEDTQLMLRNEVLSHDPTRPVTQAVSTDWGTVFQNWDTMSDPAFTHLDVAGYNYLPQFYEPDHARHPDRVMVCTESFPKDALAYWNAVEDHPYVIGDFVWTVMDYLGESGLAHTTPSNQGDTFFKSWPWHNAWCGDLDICGLKKPQSYYRDVVWGESQIELVVRTPRPAGIFEIVSWWGWPSESRSWNWAGREGEPIEVVVYSRCERVRLELDGQVIGEQPVSEATNLTASFSVPYAAGELRAVGLVNGQSVAETTLATTGEPASIRLSADRSVLATSRNDLAYVTVEVIDADGHVVPEAEISVQFSVVGAGELAGQASGHPYRPASFRAPECRTFNGRCLVVLRPTGEAGTITLQAEADGLGTSALSIDVACPADLADPIGVLDAADVFAVLALFDVQDPRIDLADPVGVFNFFDVTASLARYDRGCP